MYWDRDAWRAARLQRQIKRWPERAEYLRRQLSELSTQRQADRERAHAEFLRLEAESRQRWARWEADYRRSKRWVWALFAIPFLGIHAALWGVAFFYELESGRLDLGSDLMDMGLAGWFLIQVGALIFSVVLAVTNRPSLEERREILGAPLRAWRATPAGKKAAEIIGPFAFLTFVVGLIGLIPVARIPLWLTALLLCVGGTGLYFGPRLDPGFKTERESIGGIKALVLRQHVKIIQAVLGIGFIGVGRLLGWNEVPLWLAILMIAASAIGYYFLPKMSHDEKGKRVIVD